MGASDSKTAAILTPYNAQLRFINGLLKRVGRHHQVGLPSPQQLLSIVCDQHVSLPSQCKALRISHPLSSSLNIPIFPAHYAVASNPA